jgi:hypothetical protein
MDVTVSCGPGVQWGPCCDWGVSCQPTMQPPLLPQAGCAGGGQLCLRSSLALRAHSLCCGQAGQGRRWRRGGGGGRPAVRIVHRLVSRPGLAACLPIQVRRRSAGPSERRPSLALPSLSHRIPTTSRPAVPPPLAVAAVSGDRRIALRKPDCP